MSKGTGARLSRAGYRENGGVGPAGVRACLGKVGAYIMDLNDKDPSVLSRELDLYSEGTLWSRRRKTEPYSGDRSLRSSKNLIWGMGKFRTDN